MLLTYLAGCDEIPAYAGMTVRIYFGKKLKVPSFQRKLESTNFS